MVYKWKTGSRFKTDVNVAVKVMKGLAEKGSLTPEALVDASRPEDAPLHSEFEWDDAKAAEEWRKQTGRVMIGSVVYIQEDQPKMPPVRAYYHIEQKESVYEPIEVILRNDEKADKLFRLAVRELSAFRDKYASIKSFASLFREIGKLEQMTISA